MLIGTQPLRLVSAVPSGSFSAGDSVGCKSCNPSSLFLVPHEIREV